MTNHFESTAEDASELERALVELRRVIVGQERLVERLLVTLVAGGHCLLEGPVPSGSLTRALTWRLMTWVFGSDLPFPPCDGSRPRPSTPAPAGRVGESAD